MTHYRSGRKSRPVQGEERTISHTATLRGNRRRTYKIKSYHLTVTQSALQENWSIYRTRRHSKDALAPFPEGRMVEWTAQVTVLCNRCGHRLGAIVAFHTDDLCGVVDDTPRWANLSKHDMREITTGLANGKPLWMHVTETGRKAQVHFRCRQCHRDRQPRNAHDLGRRIVADELAQISID